MSPLKYISPQQNNFSVLASALCKAPKHDKDQIVSYLHL